jgi:hypothetical protein
LTCEEAVDRLPMDAEDAADSNGVEPALMDQAANRFRMHAELGSDLPNAHQTWLISV